MPPAGPASDHEREQQPAEQVPAQPGPAAPGQAPGPLGADPDRLADDWANLPAHPTARPLRQAAVARLQARHGNRHVQRRLQAGQPLPVQRFWGLFKPTQPQMPQNWPDMTGRVASLKNEAKVYLNLSTAYINGGKPNMDRVVSDIDQELTKYAPNDKADCMAVVNGQRDKIEQHRQRFVPQFEASARDTVYTLLDTSRQNIRDEMARYGMHEGMETKDGQTRGTGKMEVNPTAEMDELSKAAKHIAGEAEKLFNLGYQLKEKYGARHKGGPMEEADNRGKTEKDVLGDPTYVEAHQKYEQLYAGYMTKFPILAALKDEPLAVAGLRSGGKSEAANALVWDKLKDKLDNIEKTRANVADGSLRVLALPNLVAAAKKALTVTPDSLENRFVDDTVAQVKADEDLRNKALAAIGLTVAIVAAVATAGGSLVVAAGATGFGLGLSAGQILEKLQDIQVHHAAGNTDLDKAKSISQQDPDLFWLAVDIILFVADVVQAGKLLRAAAGPVRKFTNARVSAERAGGGKLTADEGERLTKMLADDVDPALAGLPDQARQRVRAKLDPSGKMPSVVSASAQGARWTDATLQTALRGSGPGQDAWRLMGQHKTTLAISPTNATYFDPKTNTIFISRGLDADQAAQAFVHEMTHADWAKTGRSVGTAQAAKGMSRFEYVNKMCREEAAAEVNAIKHKFQSQTKAGKPIQAFSPVEQVYSDAFSAEANRLRAVNPNMDESMLRMRAEIVGEEAVYQAFVQGRVTNSVTKESYVIYYGREWDQVNMPLPRYPMPP